MGVVWCGVVSFSFRVVTTGNEMLRKVGVDGSRLPDQPGRTNCCASLHGYVFSLWGVTESTLLRRGATESVIAAMEFMDLSILLHYRIDEGRNTKHLRDA